MEPAREVNHRWKVTSREKQMADNRYSVFEKVEAAAEQKLLAAISSASEEFKKKYPADSTLKAEMSAEFANILKMISTFVEVKEGEKPQFFPIAIKPKLSAGPITIGDVFVVNQAGEILTTKASLFLCKDCVDWHIDELIPVAPSKNTLEELQKDGISVRFLVEGIEKNAYRFSVSLSATQLTARA